VPEDLWAAGDRYEPYVGRWSRLVARDFVGWLTPSPGADWLDVGCGTGALSGAILAGADPRGVVAADPSLPFVGYARATLADDRVRFTAGDARALPVADGRFGYAVCGLVLNFVGDPAQAVREMRRATVDGGTVAAYVWDYAGRMELMRYLWDAAEALDPAAAALDEGKRFTICHPDRLTSLFSDSGLSDVDVRPIDVPTVFGDFEDFWTPFLGGVGPAPAYVMGLDEDRRGRLRERLRATVPVAADGSIPLVARAWAVRGRAAHL
jgi:SAM-dependent methyltransferase